MKPQSAKNIVHKLIIANLTVVFILMLLGAGHAKSLKSQGPPFPFPGGKKGQEAITALQGRLPEVASKHFAVGRSRPRHARAEESHEIQPLHRHATPDAAGRGARREAIRYRHRTRTERVAGKGLRSAAVGGRRPVRR